MTMLLKTINGARRWRLGTLAALTLTAFIPPAIPATASASTAPSSFLYGQYNSPPGYVFINNVKAVARTSGHPVFKVKFQFRVGDTRIVSAFNRAKAVTKCTGCSAVAIGFQVVTTTEHDLAAFHLLNVATADTTTCAPDCNAVADAYQVVVATDTPRPLSLGWFLTPRQMSRLSRIRSEFLALPGSGLTLSQVQSRCEDLVDKVAAILQSGSGGTPDYTGATRPFSSRSEPIVKVYRDIRFDRQMAR
jgi:hypothetical protein